MDFRKSNANRVRWLSFAVASVLIPGTAVAQNPIIVTNGADSGPGSLRAALNEAAAHDEPVPIVIVTRNDIGISSTLTYSGRAADPLRRRADRLVRREPNAANAQRRSRPHCR